MGMHTIHARTDMKVSMPHDASETHVTDLFLDAHVPRKSSTTFMAPALLTVPCNRSQSVPLLLESPTSGFSNIMSYKAL